MKHRLQTFLRHKPQWLLLLTMLFGISQVAWCTTYYVYGGTTSKDESSLKGWTSVVTSADGDDNGFSFDLSISSYAANTNYYYGICRSSSNFLPNSGSVSDWRDHIIVYTNGSVTDNGVTIEKGENYIGSCNFFVLRVNKGTSSASKITISFTKLNSSETSCNNSATESRWEADLESSGVPTVTTGSASNITNSSVDLGGSITYTGTSEITASGIKLYTSSSNCTDNTSATTIATDPTVKSVTSYTINKTGLSASTTYHYKAYATNSSGTSYGSCSSFTTSAAVTETAPTVRWGNAPAVTNQDIVTSAYVALHGCNSSTAKTVKKLRLYIKKGAAPTTSSFDKMYEFTRSGDYPTNTLYTNTIPSDDEWLSSITSSTTLYMGYVAINDNENINASAMSDIATISYGCAGRITKLSITPAGKQVKQGQSVTFTASALSGESTASVSTWSWKVNSGSYSSGEATKTLTIPAEFSSLSVKADNSCGSKEATENYTLCTASIGESVAITSATAIDDEIPVTGLSNITFTATLSSGTAYKWEWLLDGVVVNTTTPSPETSTNSHTINFSGYTAGDYVVSVRATGCPSTEVLAEKTLRFRNAFPDPTAQTKAFTACENGNRMAINDMFGITPDYVTALNSEVDDVTDEFEYKDGYLYWIATSQSGFSLSRVYTLTAHKKGYIDKSSTLTFTFAKDIPAEEPVITAPSDGLTVNPWVDVTLTATCSSGSILWSVLPVTASITPIKTNSGASATFRGKPGDNSDKTYRIKAQVISASCGTSEGNTVSVKVTRETEDPCPGE